ncbi:phosphotransferase [Allonocardiopsis opalescens]|uniref:Phosphotransferase family enzyme n=1 Tax=Allonocardiopsis opalescens TaxID=1144618 RepID=A0A2T0Q005_9ACTN|nr:phosphotransferase [Allonocardiopsis opalescens]PRX97132.1 phosphotransferase family enzyme [Allonocardiopsis opalescens]
MTHPPTDAPATAPPPWTAAGPRAGLRLGRAWPRSERHVLLEWRRPDGGTVAGQWFADRAELLDALGATGGAASADTSAGVLLQPGGADRRLRRLAELARTGELLVHRPERRAVLRTAGGYLKAVRPSRLADLLARTERAAGHAAGFTVPVRLGHDERLGTALFSTVPGRTLFALGADPATAPGDLARAWLRAGRALAALHAAPAEGLPAHTAADEHAVALRWAGHAWRFGLLPRPDPASLPAAPEPGPVRLIHRDLHDKQLLTGDAAAPGLVDLDTLAAGDPALDVANLLVHLELRAAQGLLTGGRAELARTAFLGGLAPDEATLARAGGYAAATRLRLAAVYAFRPRWCALARRLQAEALRPMGGGGAPA